MGPTLVHGRRKPLIRCRLQTLAQTAKCFKIGSCKRRENTEPKEPIMRSVRTGDARVDLARAITFDTPLLYGADPRYRDMKIAWGSAFDCACYIVSRATVDLSDTPRLNSYIDWLVSTTGFSEEELLTHGRHVRRALATLYRSSRELRRASARVPLTPVAIRVALGGAA